ncbi:MAG: hypothetical protein AB9M60_11335 [Leptothrix sp. (in: b-proteobacteria)]
MNLITRHARAATLVSLALSACVLSPARADEAEHDDDLKPYAIGLWGDLPYSDAQSTVGLPNLIADMNAHHLKFTAHDGDLKAGSGNAAAKTGFCDAALYQQSLDFFNALLAPAIFTPGDNDWTDCDRPANGGFNSRGRLDLEREVFFSKPFSLGKRKLRQEVQTAALCLNEVGDPVACSENRRWHLGGVTYATLNVAGSCNNLCDTAPDRAEFEARNTANIAWLKDTFASAGAHSSAAVMLITQANPGWDKSDATRAPVRDPQTLAEAVPATDGYQAYLLALRDEVTAFRKPVAYVHGDSHYFRVDKPFLNAKGQRLENFTRVETFGNNAQNGTNDVQWIKVTVDARSRDVFTYQPMIVPGNRVAVPAP